MMEEGKFLSSYAIRTKRKNNNADGDNIALTVEQRQLNWYNIAGAC